MAPLTAANNKTADPFLVAKFWIEIEGVTEAVFRECSGLSVETEILEFPEGGVNDHVHKLPGRSKFSNITLKRGWCETDDLWKWYAKVIAGNLKPRPVSIVMYENKGVNAGKQVCRWNLEAAYPIKWQGPDFRSDGNGVAIETLVLAHAGWKVEYS